VFTSVRIHQEQPELLIEGVIYQFAESRSRPWYARLPLIGRLPPARERVEGGVRLQLTVSTPPGRVVGTYHGHSIFPDPAKPSEREERPPGTHLDRAFTKVVRQIRDQMLADPQLMGGGWRQSIPGAEPPSQNQEDVRARALSGAGGQDSARD
jgi:hypothetical protein